MADVTITLTGDSDDLARILALWTVYSAGTSDDCMASIAPALELIGSFANAITGIYREPEADGGNYLLSTTIDLTPWQRTVAKHLLELPDL